MARVCRGPKKNKGHDNPTETEKILKMVQKMLVKCKSKSEVFLWRRRLPDESFPRVTVINVK